MLTIGLVVMVIFLFLRNLSATIIPSVAVPLSLVGTFGVMYLLGYSLNNLTLMALTISTGFVVDDAIVMIENIVRFIEEGEHPLRAALKGAEQIGFTIISLTVSLVAVLDSAVVHGRHCGPAVPRVRRDAVYHDSGFRRGFAHADADDVLETAEAHAGSAAEPFLSSVGKSMEQRDRPLRQDVAMGIGAANRHAAGGSSDFGPHDCAFHRHPERLFPDSGHRRDSGNFRGRADHIFRRNVARTAATGESDFAGSGGREPVVVHRRGWNQHHPEQRAHFDQSETAGRPQDQRQRRDNPPAAEAGPDIRHYLYSCSRCRI